MNVVVTKKVNSRYITKFLSQRSNFSKLKKRKKMRQVIKRSRRKTQMEILSQKMSNSKLIRRK